jgi:hypothetical protein
MITGDFVQLFRRGELNPDRPDGDDAQRRELAFYDGELAPYIGFCPYRGGCAASA